MSSPIVTEVCVDSLESVITVFGIFKRIVESHKQHLERTQKSNAITLRFELCSALHQGGLTPSFGFVASVVEFLEEKEKSGESRFFSVELYIMIRSRPGLEFVTPVDSLDFHVMMKDVEMFGKNFAQNNHRQSLVKGIVFGSLIREEQNPSSPLKKIRRAVGIDKIALHNICNHAASHGFSSLTFHRAIDYLGEDAGPAQDESIFLKCLQEIALVHSQVRKEGQHENFKLFLLTSGGITQNSSLDNAAAVDFLREKALNINEKQLDWPQNSDISIIIGGGVNAAVVDKVFSGNLNSKLAKLESSVDILGVHFSGKKLVCPPGVPQSETCWEIDAKLVEELFSLELSKVVVVGLSGKL